MSVTCLSFFLKKKGETGGKNTPLKALGNGMYYNVRRKHSDSGSWLLVFWPKL